MQKHSQHNNDERTQFFWKIYLSHFIRNGWKGLQKGYVWEVSWGLNKDWNILTSSSSDCSITSFPFCWAAQPGALRAQLSAGSGSHCLELHQPTPNSKLNFLLHRVISLFDAHLLLVSVTFAPNSTCPGSRLYPDIFDQFPDWQLGQYVTIIWNIL